MKRILGPDGLPLPTAKERAMAAAKAEYQRKLKASYDAAAITSENAKHWQWADSLSAGEANRLSVRKLLRSRSRYECHESNSFACGITDTLATDFVTTGPGLQIRLKGSRLLRQLGEEIEQAWKRWCRSVKLRQKLWTARLAKCVDGETFLIATNNPKIRGPVQLDVQLVECDQISTPGWLDGGLDPLAVDGIKFDRYGNPTEYHMLQSHPGDLYGAIHAFDEPKILDPDHVIHLFKSRRPGQKRGVPEVTPALPLFALLRRYTLATIVAAETAADFAVVLKTLANAFATELQPHEPFDSVEIDRGMMTTLPYGYEMQQMKAEQPTTTYEQFRNAILQEIARCISMPTNKARGDSSGYNYSSARHDQQIYYHAIEVERKDWEDECLDKIFEWWFDESLLSNRRWSRMLGAILDELPRRWTWRPPVSIDPATDADTALALRDGGLLTEEEYFESRQMDPDYVWAQIDREAARRAARPERVQARRKSRLGTAKTISARRAERARRSKSRYSTSA